MNMVKTDPTDKPQIVEVFHKYKQPSGQIDWGRARADHPDLFAKLEKGRSFASVKQVFYRAARDSGKPAMAKGPKSGWSTDELDSIKALVAKHTDVSGTIRWSEMRDEPAMQQLLANHTMKEITNRYYHIDYTPPRRAGKKVKRAAGKLSAREAGRLGGLKSRSKNHLLFNAKPVERVTDPAPVAPQPTPRSEVSFCPYCGHDIKNLIR